MFKFTVTPDAEGAEPFELDATMRDLRVWEKTHHKRSLGQATDGAAISATMLFEIAYSACVRQRKIPAGLTEEQFAEQYEIEPDDDGEDADAEQEAGPTLPVA